jgi:D-3-phosphoglycerate dehydrogenase
MKSIFIDCNNQLAPVFARVRRPDDPPIAVNSDAFQSADLPRLLAGYDVCLDDHSYMPTEVMAQCRGLKHIVFLGTGASSYMDVPERARHQGAHHQGLRRRCGRRAHDGADIRLLP